MNNKGYSKILTKKFLIKEYLIKKKSSYQIGIDVGIPYKTVYKYLVKYDIPRRNQSEALKSAHRWLGKDNPHYKDGSTAGKHYCKKCNKQLRNKYAKFCNKCKLNKNTIIKHHIYMNKSNKTIKLLAGKHRKLHQRAYEYLVEIEKVDDYLNYFDKKYGLK